MRQDTKKSEELSYQFEGIDKPEDSGIYSCVHCGFCLQSCPTYLQTGLEAESPRGRIALMKGVSSSRISITEKVSNHWDLCIQCRACEAACPSGVPYGELIEAVSSQLARVKKPSMFKKIFTWIALEKILLNQRILEFSVRLMRIYQRWGFQWIVRKTKILNLFPSSLSNMEDIMPEIPSKFFKYDGNVIPAKSTFRSRVALLSGCIMPFVHGSSMESVIEVLTENGCEVVVPTNQSCCGAIHSHIGDLDRARELARINLDAFIKLDIEAIVVASAGCGARLKEYSHLLRNDPEYNELAKKFSSMVKDIHEFLYDLPIIPPTGELNYTVTYQDSCHLSNVQKIKSQPRDILNMIPGLNFVELPNSSICCGAGGTYFVTQPQMSNSILDDKMSSVKITNADILATANPGCLIQLQAGASKYQPDLQVVYVVDLLAKSYKKQKSKKTH
tara:strand:- start:328 stop:1665 length:1338 start_codon:yes stop_codon:yes gene_type:complete